MNKQEIIQSKLNIEANKNRNNIDVTFYELINSVSFCDTRAIKPPSQIGSVEDRAARFCSVSKVGLTQVGQQGGDVSQRVPHLSSGLLGVVVRCCRSERRLSRKHLHHSVFL